MRRVLPRAVTRVVTVLAFLAFLVPIMRVDASVPQWTLVDELDGIRVWSLEIPGRDLPGFRGVTVMDASIPEIIHEILDVEHQPDWLYGMQEGRVVKRLSETRSIVYKRFKRFPPSLARDLLMDLDYRYTPAKTAATVRFRTTDEVYVRVPRKTVRIPKLDGFYRLWQERPGFTNVLYQVEMDIGPGLDPEKSKEYARRHPHDTLINLRKRIVSKRRS